MVPSYLVRLGGGIRPRSYKDRGRARHIFPSRLVRLGGGIRPRSYRGLALAELGHPDVTTGDTACLRRYSKGAVLSTLRWRDNTAPFAVCFSLPLSPPRLKKYLRNILEKHCSGRPHNLRWSYHAIRPEGQPQMRNHYYKYLLCILLLIACVLLVILAVLSNNNPGNGKDGTASTHAPSSTSTYWDKDRMESASPAPMPE